MAILIARIALAVCLALPAGTLAETNPGDAAPDFTLERLVGGAVSLSDSRGRVVIVDVWASWCTVCRKALPALDALARRHPDIVVLAVTVDHDRNAVERFLEAHLPDPGLTILLDPRGTLPSRYGAPAMPSLYLIDRSGTVRAIEAGYREGDIGRIEEHIKRLLGEGSER